MGYLYLFIALLAGATKGHCSKKTSMIVESVSNITLMNAVRMMLCVVIGFFFVLISSKGFSGFALDGETALVCLLSGGATSFFIITWTISVKKSAYSMLNIFLVLSTLIPVILCRLIWNEEIKAFKIVGFVLLFIAVCFMWIYNKKVKGRFKVKDVIILFICAMFNGLASFAQKWRFFECKETLSAYAFNFYTYLFGLAILLIFYLFTKATIKSDEKFVIKKVIGYVVILSICLFLNSLFYSMAAETLPSSVLYPLSNGLGLVIAMLLGHFLYNEKINRYSLIGISIAIVSFVFMIL